MFRDGTDRENPTPPRERKIAKDWKAAEKEASSDNVQITGCNLQLFNKPAEHNCHGIAFLVFPVGHHK